MPQVCHAHCPDDSGALLAALAAVILTAVLAAAVAQVIASLFVAIVITGAVLIAAGIALFVFLVHRDRRRATIPIRPASAPPRVGVAVRAIPQRSTQAISAPRPPAIGAPGRTPAAVPAAALRLIQAPTAVTQSIPQPGELGSN